MNTCINPKVLVTNKYYLHVLHEMPFEVLFHNLFLLKVLFYFRVSRKYAWVRAPALVAWNYLIPLPSPFFIFLFTYLSYVRVSSKHARVRSQALVVWRFPLFSNFLFTYSFSIQFLYYFISFV